MSSSIVAVHGLGASNWTWIHTEKTNGKKTNWLKDRDMLPELVPSARIMQFAYESAWIGAHSIDQRLSLIADQLLESLANRRAVSDTLFLHGAMTDNFSNEYRHVGRGLSFSLHTLLGAMLWKRCSPRLRSR